MAQEKVLEKKRFRPEIEGVRVIAALLVAIYHIWLGRVSGGVDVFFVVSGFLITASLVSRHLREGYVDFFKFIWNLLKRLLPASYFVLSVVTILAILFLPSVQWRQLINELIASMFYFENWRLAIDSVDYLDSSNPQSPLQHFWAMSIQGQFYIILFLIVTVAIFISKQFKINMKKVLTVLFVITFLASFLFSIYQTSVNQPVAYFDTRTRMYEFIVGGLLFLFIDKIKISKSLSFLVGWLGLIGLILCGIIFDVSTLFPGAIALWPVMCAVLILIAGQNSTNLGVENFLGHKVFVKLGSYSYAFYLWHWVVLIFYKTLYDMEIGILDGSAILFTSIILSYITTEFIEKPLRSKKRPFIYKFSPILIVLIVTSSFLIYKYESNTIDYDGFMYSEDHPGAMSILTEHSNYDKSASLIPNLAVAKDDLPGTYETDCNQMGTRTEAKNCTVGNEDAEYKVALVGGSHSAHWYGAFEEITKQDENINVTNITKSACRFSAEHMTDDCDQWNENVLELLSEMKPDLVILTADIGNNLYPDVPEGYLTRYAQLEEMGIEIMAIRDNPWFEVNIPECIEEHGPNSVECEIDREEVLPTPSKWDKLEEKPGNVNYVDYSEHFCDEEVCYPTKGNVIIYFDENHITNTYVKTITPFIREDLMSILN